MEHNKTLASTATALNAILLLSCDLRLAAGWVLSPHVRVEMWFSYRGEVSFAHETESGGHTPSRSNRFYSL